MIEHNLSSAPEHPHKTHHKSEELWGALLFGAALCGLGAFVIQILNRPLSWLLAVMPDDIFYYLQVARNLADTGVSTFDGETLTNGYHPGWMLLMTALAHIFNERIALLHACLISTFVLHALSSLIMVRALRPFCGPFWAWVGGAFWLLNPLPLRVALQGMEGTFYVWALLITICIFNQRVAPHLRVESKFLPWLDCAVFGLSLGLAFWARTEGLLLAAISLMYLGFSLWRSSHSMVLNLRAIARVWLFTGGTFVLCIAPWFLYSLLETGSLTQKSGAMKMLWAAQDHAQGDVIHQLLATLIFLCAWWFSVAPTILFNQTSSISMLLICTSAFLFITYRLRQPSQAKRAINTDNTAAWRQMVAWLSPMFILSGVVYGGLFSDHRTWYWGQPGVIFFVLFFSGVVLCCQQKLSPSRDRLWFFRLGGISVVIYGAALCFLFSRNVPAVYGLQPGAYESLSWMQERIPANSRVGAFNAGVPAYFTNMKVINLDGLMNNTVADRWRSHDFDSYLQEAHINYIADLQGSLDRAKPFCKGDLRLQKIAYHAPSQRTLWRVLLRERTN